MRDSYDGVYINTYLIEKLNWLFDSAEGNDIFPLFWLGCVLGRGGGLRVWRCDGIVICFRASQCIYLFP